MSQPLIPDPQIAPEAKTNTLALVSLIVALAPIILIFIPYVNCIAFLCPIAAIILGIIGLTQVKKTMQRGKGMAIGGIIIGAFWIILIPVILIAGVSLFGPLITNIFNQIQNNLGGSVY
jgi:Flp pilus assembly pilin Flp